MDGMSDSYPLKREVVSLVPGYHLLAICRSLVSVMTLVSAIPFVD